MKSRETDKIWRGMSEEIIVGMTEWRQQNPKAPFREIEAELDRRLADLRVRMLADLALASASAEWERGGRSTQMPELWSGAASQREKEAEPPKQRGTRGEVRARIWSLSRLWARDFSPWMKNWNCCQGI
jgi:hypothetical protein